MFDLGSFLPFFRFPRNMSKIYSLRRSCRVVGPIRNMNINIYIIYINNIYIYTIHQYGYTIHGPRSIFGI